MSQNQTSSPGMKMNEFSVALGLLDYINPIFYAVTSMILIHNMKTMSPMHFMMLCAGIGISLIGGFIIPTGKLLVGLGRMKFRMPVSIVFCVNSGILLTGLALFSHIAHLEKATLFMMMAAVAAFLLVVILATHKVNTAAVLCGAGGYLLIYISLILTALSVHMNIPVYLYLMAIGLFVFLCYIGIKANLYDARIHWVIEICNVMCQGLVALATFVLFRFM